MDHLKSKNYSVSRWQRWLSYLFERHLETISSDHNPHLYVSLSKGRLQLSTANAIYSFEDLYDNFRLAFQAVDWQRFPGERVLLLGLGLGSVPQLLERYFQQAFSYLAVEVDEAVIYLAQKYVLHELRSPMETICADAAAFVGQSNEAFDLITMDVFEDDRIPEKFGQKDFLESLERLLTPDGLLMYNCLARTKEDKRRTRSFFENTFRDVFPEAISLPVRGNAMLLNHDRFLKASSRFKNKPDAL
jgi:spermidine synthase